MPSTSRFLILATVSLVVVAGILAFVLRSRPPARARLWLVAAAVGPGGMLVAKYGAGIGMPWWLFYTVPALLTLLVPVLAFRMTRQEAMRYVALALVSAPVIHIVFSLTLGWREYMPFLPVP